MLISLACPFCSSKIETVVHLLLHGDLSWRVCSDGIVWWGMNWVFPLAISHLALGLDEFKGKESWSENIYIYLGILVLCNVMESCYQRINWFLKATGLVGLKLQS